jgi:tetratricopeptide (TPR) repeat protein
MENGDRDEAFSLFVEAIELNPENMVALFSLIRLGHELERIGEIIPHLENYLEIDPAKHEVRYSLAGCLACVGQKDAAVNELETILEKDPENGPAKEMLDQFRS